MNLDSYFENVKGVGILATSDKKGNADAAIYARPYVIDEKIIMFSMMERTSYGNVMANPNACFLFMEKGEGFKGYRFYLRQRGEETNEDNIKMLRKTHNIMDIVSIEKRHLVYFEIKQVRPLIGDKE
jgi:uncharacterized pyridoxamine 5'-phosphate oxidase family protein